MAILTSKWARTFLWCGFGLLMLPGVWAIAATLIAKGLSCPPTGNTVAICQSLGHSIQQALQYNLNIFLLYFPTLGLPLWIILLLAYRSYQGWGQAIIIFFCIWWLPHSYSFLGIITSLLLQHDSCELYGGGLYYTRARHGKSITIARYITLDALYHRTDPLGRFTPILDSLPSDIREETGKTDARLVDIVLL